MKDKGENRVYLPGNSFLWVLFYCYSTAAAVVFQKILLPAVSRFHGSGGLIGGDSVLFHKVALDLANSIRMNGWGAWTSVPSQGITGNVSMLAALYVLFGNDPMVILPINALIHSLSGFIIFAIARILWPGRVGTISGIITASLFIAFPSALNWYGQIHKDGFAILGMLLIFYSSIQLTVRSSRFRKMMWAVCGNLAGLALIIFVRPYNVIVLLVAAIFICFTVLLYFAFKRGPAKVLYLVIFFGLLVLAVKPVDVLIPKHWAIEKRAVLLEYAKNVGIDWTWQRSERIPLVVDRIVEGSASARVVSIYHNALVGAGSLIDGDIRPNNVFSALAYMPRAAFIACFAPFPNMWFKDRSVIRLVAVAETMIWYFFIPGIFLAFCYRPTILMVIAVLYAVVFLTALGFAQPNLGTLYRFRYLYIFFLMLIGCMGWVECVRRRYGEWIKFWIDRRKNERDQLIGHQPPQTGDSHNVRLNIVGSGFIVVSFTFLSNMLLVLRDIVLARWFGLGNDLDAFFIAMIVPMFLVTVLSIPIGTVVIPPLIESIEKKSREETQRLITLCSTVILVFMFCLCSLLYISGRYYLPVIGWGFSPEKILLSRKILMIVLPILFFSGFVILGNSILNARRKFALPALAQAIVPLIAILFLVASARYIGIYAMAFGMIAGQLLNLLIVDHYVRKEGYKIFPMPRLSAARDLCKSAFGKLRSSLLPEYAPLVVAALFVSLGIPVNNMIAASLSPGSVSAYGLGTKFIAFFTGLIGTGISTVMLPHFSSYFATDRIVDARKELSFFLFAATIISIPLTVIIYLLTGPMVNVIFKGGLFTVQDIGIVSRITEYGIIQLPFFCANMLLVKFANARRKNGLVMITSVLALAINVVLNFLFIGKMGVAGIALASSWGVILGTAFFVLAGYQWGDINPADTTLIFLTWILYLTIILYHHYHNTPGIIITASVLVYVAVRHFALFIRGAGELQADRC